MDLYSLFDVPLSDVVECHGADVSCDEPLEDGHGGLARDGCHGLPGLRETAVDVWRESVDQLIVHPLSPLSLLSADQQETEFTLISFSRTFKGTMLIVDLIVPVIKWERQY